MTKMCMNNKVCLDQLWFRPTFTSYVSVFCMERGVGRRGRVLKLFFEKRKTDNFRPIFTILIENTDVSVPLIITNIYSVNCLTGSTTKIRHVSNVDSA